METGKINDYFITYQCRILYKIQITVFLRNILCNNANFEICSSCSRKLSFNNIQTTLYILFNTKGNTHAIQTHFSTRCTGLMRTQTIPFSNARLTQCKRQHTTKCLLAFALGMQRSSNANRRSSMVAHVFLERYCVSQR